jgi:hypothetical protein
MAEELGGAVGCYDYDRDPDFCPLCHVKVMPRLITAIHSNVQFGERIQAVFRCPNQDCDRLFIAYYGRQHFGPARQHGFHLENVAPVSPFEEQFSAEIKDTSPTFVEIYNQAIAAESHQLDQVAGMGLRKALEFLIKDFLIKQRPAEKDIIERTMLSPCINNYVDEPNLKQCAERATWLGNDETHYQRKWVDKDINDLKILIKLSVNWISTVLLTERYAKEMTK